MDSDQGKLFIGGISWDTTEDKLKEHFSNYGDVLQTAVMRDKITGKPRGFGFVVFADPSVLDSVLQDKHTIDGRTVDAKRALSREEQQSSVTVRAGNPNSNRSSVGGANMRTKKIFVGGLPPTLTEEKFCQYFEAYGHVTDVVVMYDQNTGRPRGFGFISFDTEDAVDRVLHKTYHDLNGKQVEVKRALPKDANPGSGGRVGGVGGYQGYGSSGGNSNSFDGRMDSNRYMQPQGTEGGFPPYGSSGYSATGYGYGPVNNGVGYGGYANYGGASSGYGGPGGATYGSPNVPNNGYASGPPGATRTSWSSQAPSGYGSMSYGNTAPWGAPSGGAGSGGGGPGSVPSGQSPSGGTGYGSQGYGYGGYGGSDSSYGNQGAYGAVGGRSGSVPNSNAGGPGSGDLQGSGSGYIGSGFGDTNGNSGYGNAAWRSDPTQASGNYGTPQGNGPHGGQGGFGIGYGGAQARQAQQQ
ncbi:heterogeneous nuclear ribonucleoprotein 1-like [Quillaja saponaria]|uniref:Heterogeneous nuclear ribonucleoprotein 1-like n=1 Tax=Quillaja saponaria TaxID=32244 RepID=A0AAD7LB91_QUISA|nr:heterogeneous nuclear ribonucleoprotein 1-like [Quillaja saponaria]KAJ7954669.1 heterogeneous nuclear ribonucleoprotein 1-like [Quillaja saponaria]